MAVFQEAGAGLPLAKVRRKHGISRPTYFAWKAKVRRNLGAGAQQKRMYAELALWNTAIKDVLNRKL